MHNTTLHPFVRRLALGRPQKVVFYGTSLTAEGAWTKQLLAALNARFSGLVTHANGAESGMHSGWGADNFATRVISHNPDVLFLEFSVNDACARFALSLEESRGNLERMIEQVQRHNRECEVILQVMNPILDRPLGHAGYRANLAGYQSICRDVGRERGLLVIDHMPAWAALLAQDEATFRRLVPDGLHPNADGYDHVVTPEILYRLGLGRQSYNT